jgi:hypothetical protein
VLKQKKKYYVMRKDNNLPLCSFFREVPCNSLAIIMVKRTHGIVQDDAGPIIGCIEFRQQSCKGNAGPLPFA